MASAVFSTKILHPPTGDIVDISPCRSFHMRRGAQGAMLHQTAQRHNLSAPLAENTDLCKGSL